MNERLRPADELLSEERAREIWRRAARLQAEAAERLEARSHSLARRGTAATREGYRVTEIEAAARDAGIAPEFVRLALAESTVQERRDRRLSPRMNRLVTRLLGTDRRHVEASLVIAASPEAVFEAMQRVFPQHPYRLELRESIGDDPLNGAVLIFGTPAYMHMPTDFALDMAHADLKELHVVLRPVRAAEGDVASEVTITSDLEYGRRLNLWVGGGAVSTGALGGGALTTALAIGGGLGLAVAAAPIAAGVALGGGAFGVAWRAVYGWSLNRGIRALDRLLRALDVNTRTRGAFAQPPPSEPEAGVP